MKPLKSFAWAGRKMKSLKSFVRQEPRKIGNVLVIASMILSIFLLSLIKSHYCPNCVKSQEVHHRKQLPMKVEMDAVETHEISEAPSLGEDEDDESVKAVNASRPTCYEVSPRSDTCEVGGDIRVEASSGTIFFDTSSVPSKEWSIKPYARKGDPIALANVREWTLKPLTSNQQIPKCTKKYTVPAMIFSVGGFTGNLFHDFTDVLVPLFISSHQFRGEVQLLVADYKSWWINKFKLIFKQLSNYEIVDLDNDKEEVRCFPRVIVGPSFHKELGVDGTRTPRGYTILDFKDVMREAFGLERGMASRGNTDRKPRLLIIARKHSRAFVNLKEMIDIGTNMGFDVVTDEPDVNTQLHEFAKLVNSADVMIGVHGAGLTNMVFLPMGAVVVQVIPLGGLEWLAKDSFKDPALEMKMSYLDYIIQADESTLSDKYDKNHPVLKDPLSFHKQGWDALKSVYFDSQNVKMNVEQYKELLSEALRLLPNSTTTI